MQCMQKYCKYCTCVYYTLYICLKCIHKVFAIFLLSFNTLDVSYIHHYIIINTLIFNHVKFCRGKCCIMQYRNIDSLQMKGHTNLAIN